MGAAHRRDRRPNQDALCVWPADGAGDVVIVAVADGHGDRRSLRSDRGSTMAALTAVSVLRVLAKRPQVDTAALRQSAAQITKRWQDMVLGDVADDPLDGDEHASLLAYGSTLVAAVATATYVAVFQLGDGDVLAVDRQEHVTRVGATDDRLLGDETTSLCQPNASEEFVVSLLVPDELELLVLSTDGCSKSFDNSDEFMQVATDVRDRVNADGADVLVRELPTLLSELSATGSGDDITLGFMTFR